MRWGLTYVKQTEEAYAEQVRQRPEKQPQRRAKATAGTITGAAMVA
jgi:hypothetical protein